MQEYKVLNETGLITADEATHAVGDVISLDPADQHTIDWLASGVIAVVEAAPAPVEATPVEPAPLVPTSPFQLEVVYNPSATPEDIAACSDWLKQITAGIDETENGIPAIVDAVTVRRVS